MALMPTLITMAEPILYRSPEINRDITRDSPAEPAGYSNKREKSNDNRWTDEIVASESLSQLVG